MLKTLYDSYDKLIIIKRSVILMIIQRKDYIDKINKVNHIKTNY